MTRAKRVDNNQAEIVAEFRRLGWEVEPIFDLGRGIPDLMVKRPSDCFWHLVEVKNGNAGYTSSEMAFMKKYPNGSTTVRSAEQVKDLFG